MVVKIVERHRISANHWYRFLPRRLQFWIAHIGVKLGIIRRYGYLQVTVHHPDGTDSIARGYNIIPDVGIKLWGDILANVETTDLDIAFMEPGEGTTTPVIGDIDVADELEGSPTPARLAVTSVVRNVSTPFDVVAETFVTTSDYTRPQTINELTIWMNDDPATKLFARGVLGTGIVLNSGDTATLNYSLVFR